jgi:hypothetical protein
VAIAYVKRLGSANKNTPAALSYALTTTGGAAAAGASILVAIATRNPLTLLSVTDAVGNTYTADAARTNGNVRVYVASCHRALALPNGSLITATFNNTESIIAILADEFSDTAPGLAATGADQTANGTGTGTAIATAATAATAVANELVYAAFGVDIAATGTIPTVAPGAGYTRTTEVAAPSSALRVGVYPEYKVVAAVGTQVADGTLSASKVWAAVVATYRGATPAATSPRRPPPAVVA